MKIRTGRTNITPTMTHLRCLYLLIVMVSMGFKRVLTGCKGLGSFTLVSNEAFITEPSPCNLIIGSKAQERRWSILFNNFLQCTKTGCFDIRASSVKVQCIC